MKLTGSFYEMNSGELPNYYGYFTGTFPRGEPLVILSYQAINTPNTYSHYLSLLTSDERTDKIMQATFDGLSLREKVLLPLNHLRRRSPARRTLGWATLAFFLSFVIWFDMAPFVLSIAKSAHLSKPQIAALGLCNLVLAVPGRVLAGRLLDRFGPRRLFGWLLIAAVIPNSIFAASHTFIALALSRLALGLIGSGFVIGIRLVAEWFEERNIGVAEGIYGGWGNFGSAAAALALPSLAILIGAGSWRLGVFLPGLVGAVYGVAFLLGVKDAPDNKPFIKAKSASSLAVSNRSGLFGLLLLQVPLISVLGVVVSRLQVSHVLNPTAAKFSYAALLALLIYQTITALALNRPLLKTPAPVSEQYPFSAVVLLSAAYAVTFGTELTMVSLLPTYFATTFGLKVAAAGVAGSAFAFTNLFTRPAGGIASDISKSRAKVLSIFLAGTSAAFLILSQVTHSWPVLGVVGAIALSSIFIQGGNGAVFAMVPGIRRDITGQVAGIVGAYGNVGGLALSSVLFYTATTGSVGDVHLLFLVVSAAALMLSVACLVVLKKHALYSWTDQRDLREGVLGVSQNI